MDIQSSLVQHGNQMADFLLSYNFLCRVLKRLKGSEKMNPKIIAILMIPCSANNTGDYIKIERIEDGSVSECKFIDGVIFRKYGDFQK